ncbi:MAG TPA: FemAB family XrtA/PEP-CTERM system-associated protein [Methylomirabilota bacterium]|nr:FemAB family XrtA/PEP-CTERM system-associated protein [Methylomirabilota bacterium]
MAPDLRIVPDVMNLQVTADVDKSWDRFVESHPRATVAHLSAWGGIAREAYGHEAVYVRAEEGDEIVGVLPLVLVASRIFGRRLVSMPFLDYGGVLAEPGRGIEAALADAALGVMRERRAQGLGLRQLHPEPLPWPTTDDRVTMLLPLTTEEAVWKALPSERRNRVRKGEKQGLTATWTGPEALEEFYRVFAVNMRDLGSPVHSLGFFRAMLTALPGTARVLIVRDTDARAVGAAVCLFFRDTIMVPWVSSLREAFALCPNFVLYWEVIRFGCRQGYRVLDLGRSFRSAGTFEFKRQWGAAPHALPWIFVDDTPGARPPVDRDASRFDLLIRAWKRLPVPVANVVGPWIRRQVPN